jgi:glucosamine--fructose-6-phosphate aminotransferase (isomerizing)
MPAFKRFNEQLAGQAIAALLLGARTAPFRKGRAAERNQGRRVKKDKPGVLHKKEADARVRRSAPNVAGKQTLAEILSQPDTWIKTGAQFGQNDTLAKVLRHFSREGPWLFVACGSSYYLSRTIAAQWTKLLGVTCNAVPASELLFAPFETLKRTGARQVVLVSRSGKTTEVLRAADWLKTQEQIRTLGVTCNDNSVLNELCTLTLKLPWADEQSMVMTRSFTSILILFQRLGARHASDSALAAALDRLPQKTMKWLGVNADKIRSFAAQRQYANYVFLGQGAHYWLAQEAALKMTEMSSSYAQGYHTLEFRHGPKSIAGHETMITFLLSDAAEAEESLLIGELKKLGATTMVVVNHTTPALRRESDLLVELGMDEPEYARMALTSIPAQLLGLEVGLRKGLNPDVPKNLSRAVVLGANGAPEKRRRA